MPSPRRLAIRADHLIAFDGWGDRPLRDSVVVVEGGRIVHVGPGTGGSAGHPGPADTAAATVCASQTYPPGERP